MTMPPCGPVSGSPDYESMPAGIAPRFVIGSAGGQYGIGFVGKSLVLDGELYQPGC